MAAIDWVTDIYDKTAPDIESPPRPTMGPADHLNADQFGTNAITGSPGVKARRAGYIGGVSVHAWRDGAINDNESGH
jgi:hypothetical protein